jgi:phosphoenolpyruvate---glycerone phosphotransferase subunit DhaL
MSSTDRITSDDVVAWIRLSADVFRGEKEHLTALDSAIGDADHGINMDRGFQAVLAKLPTFPQDDVGAILKGTGMTLISTVGGASGPLYGSFFLQLGNATVGKADISVEDFAAALDNGVARVQGLGKAEPGDKTMLEALLPAQAAIHKAADAGESPSEALAAGAAAAEEGMLATIPLVARKGRASYLGERSAGHADPGATSVTLLLTAAVTTLGGTA